MCGLIGAIGNLSLASSKFLANAFVAGTVRGHHSTGAFWSTRSEEIWYYKAAVNGTEFIEHDPVAKALKNTSNLFMIGHNRWATRGGINADNAHPFIHGDISLVHNGTLDVMVEGAPNFGTDSEGIAWALDKAGSDGAIGVLESLEGAFALIWYDSGNDTLNFARNKERELYLGFTNNNLTLVASEKGMLEWLASRNKITLNSVELLPVGKHIKIKAEDMKAVSGRLVYEETDFTPKESWKWSGYSYGNAKQSVKNGWVVGHPDLRQLSASGSWQVTFDVVDSEDYTKRYKAYAYVKTKEHAEFLAEFAYEIEGSLVNHGGSLYSIAIMSMDDPTPIYGDGKFQVPQSIVDHMLGKPVSDEEDVSPKKQLPLATRGGLRLAYSSH